MLSHRGFFACRETFDAVCLPVLDIGCPVYPRVFGVVLCKQEDVEAEELPGLAVEDLYYLVIFKP